MEPRDLAQGLFIALVELRVADQPRPFARGIRLLPQRGFADDIRSKVSADWRSVR